MKLIISGIILILIIWGIYILFIKSDQWQPVFYPDTSNLTEYLYGPIVETVEQCRDWINNEAIKLEKALGDYDYECGLNCKYDSFYRTEICEETVK